MIKYLEYLYLVKKQTMLKPLFLIILWVGISNAQTITFSDPNLELAILNDGNFIDINNDHKVQITEAHNTVGLDLENYTIIDTGGLEHFINLQYLNILNNSITSIDLSRFTELATLDLRNNPLTSIDISNNPWLHDGINLSGTLISELDFSSVELFLGGGGNLFDIGNNENLIYINMKLPDYEDDPSVYDLQMSNLPNLKTICTDTSQTQFTSFLQDNIDHPITFIDNCLLLNPSESDIIFNATNKSSGLAIDNENLYISALEENKIFSLNINESGATPNILKN